MLKNSYRLVPIVEDNNLVGLFDINTLATQIQKQLQSDSVFTINRTTSFEIFKSIAGFDETDPANNNQTVVGTYFASQDASVEDIELIFKEAFQVNKLVSVVCITENGNAFEPILGIITAHDLPSANGHIDINLQ